MQQLDKILSKIESNRIAIFFPSGYIGGSEKCMLESIQSLHQRGMEIHALFPKDGPMVDLVKPYCKEVKVLFYEWWAETVELSIVRKIKFILRSAQSSFIIKDYLKRHKIDLVITATMTFPQAAVGAWLSNRKHIWYIHEFGKQDHGLSFLFGEKISCKLINLLSSKVLVNSRIVHKNFSKYIPNSKLTIINYAVDMPKLDRVILPKTNILNLVMVGRIAPGKRQEDAIRAVSFLQKKGLSVNIKLIGSFDENYLSFLKDLAEKERVTASIKFLDFTSDPMKHVRDSDIAIVCSRLEAFGRVTIEAMKCGIPVIASNTGANPEIIIEGWSGLLFEYGKPEDLANKIEILFNDDVLRDNLSINAYTWSWKNFVLEKHGQELEELLY